MQQYMFVNCESIDWYRLYQDAFLNYGTKLRIYIHLHFYVEALDVWIIILSGFRHYVAGRIFALILYCYDDV